ncbi:BNR-4 repeat-containing protein [Bradyrhizobium sp. 18]|uniref:BNR-4 repeat-containing protein n=1 Tax=Bradyrhizobium sp. 18 TaxID=2782657 RepID=UPI001FFA310F|nr:BNR-4 repeat-containing protein [Bradyrhizobium sp. 18]MCK1503845.1 BNR-4 repeat-containing protein [Bradyrhizobium sp. 18]
MMEVLKKLLHLLSPLGTVGNSYNPVTALGSDLLGYWDANRADLITQSGGAVSSWKDIVAGYDAAQATGAAQPIYSSSSFAGAPGVTFDGTAAHLTLASHPFPTGSTGCEMWALVQSDAPSSDATTRSIAAYGGGTSTGVQRAIRRTVVTSVNRAQVASGNGSAVAIADTQADFSTQHVVRGVISSTNETISVDGNTGTSTAVVSTTGSGVFRIGSLASTAAGNFLQGKVAAILITKALSVDKAAALLAYLSDRANATLSTFTQDGSTWPWYGYATQPSSMYVAATNKTWVSWLAWSGYSQEARVAVYDHAAQTWSKTYLAGDVLLSGDDHCVPSLCRDSDGYIYCFHGPHNQNIQVTRSKNPDDPSHWVTLPEIAGSYTYPHPTFIGGKIYLFMRTFDSGQSNFPLVLRVGTVSGGAISWAAEKRILDWSSKRCYQGNHILVGTDIHFVLAWADVNDTTRQNVYYCIYNTTDGSVRNFAGSTTVASGSQPINLTTADASFKIVDQSGATHEGNIPQFCFDTNGKPHVTYMDGATGGPYSLLHTMSSDGSTWIAAETVGSFSTAGQHRFDGHCIVPLTGGDVEAYWVDTGSAFTRGGSIARNQRLSGAWGTKSTVQAAGTKGLDVPTTVRDNVDAFRVALCEVSATNSTGNNCWAYGGSGFITRRRDPIRKFTMASEHLFDRMSSTPSAARQVIYDTLIRNLQAAGLWDLIDGLYLLKAHDRQAAKLNIRKGIWDLAETDTANLTFVTDGYFAGNGSSSLLTASVVPSTLIAQAAASGTANILRYAQNSAHVWGVVGNLGDAAAAFGFDDPTNGYRAVANLNATQLVARLNEATDVTYTVGAGTGFAGITRVDATNVSANVGGSAQGPTAAASQGSPTVGFTVCGLGSASSNRQVLAAGFGKALTAAQFETLRTIVNTDLTAF